MKKHLAKVSVVVAVALVLGAVGPVKAGPILGGPDGLANPQTTITFDGLGEPDFTPITNQFAASGATFQNFGYGNGDMGEAGDTGFSGQDLYSGANFGFPGAAVISFSSPVNAAAFAIVDQGDLYTINAYLGGVGGTLVDSFSEPISLFGQGFVGFQDETFDTIQLSTLADSAFAIDTLEFNNASPTPEPASLTLLGIGAVGLVGYAWRRRKLVLVAAAQ